MHGVTLFFHVEAGGFHAGCGVWAGNVKLLDAVLNCFYSLSVTSFSLNDFLIRLNDSGAIPK